VAEQLPAAAKKAELRALIYLEEARRMLHMGAELLDGVDQVRRYQALKLYTQTDVLIRKIRRGERVV